MTKAIGGYVRRCERRVTEPGPAVEMRGPNWMRYSVMPSGAVMCFRVEPPAYEMPLLPSAFLPLDVPEGSGEIMASIVGAQEPQPRPPYTHTIRPPKEHYTRSGKLLYWEKPGPAYTLTEGP